MEALNIVIGIIFAGLLLVRVIPSIKFSEFLQGFWQTFILFTAIAAWFLLIEAYIWAIMMILYLIAHVAKKLFPKAFEKKPFDRYSKAFPEYKGNNNLS